MKKFILLVLMLPIILLSGCAKKQEQINNKIYEQYIQSNGQFYNVKYHNIEHFGDGYVLEVFYFDNNHNCLASIKYYVYEENGKFVFEYVMRAKY